MNFIRAIAGIGYLTLIVAASGEALGEPLDKAACDALRAEQAGLVTAGLKSDLEKGAEWAKSNLQPDRLKQIQHYIEVEEGLAFRCRVILAPVRRKIQAKPGEPKPEEAEAGAADPPTVKVSPANSTPKAITPPRKKSASAKSTAEKPADDKPEAVRPKPRKLVARRKEGQIPASKKSGLFDVE